MLPAAPVMTGGSIWEIIPCLARSKSAVSAKSNFAAALWFIAMVSGLAGLGAEASSVKAPDASGSSSQDAVYIVNARFRAAWSPRSVSPLTATSPSAMAFSGSMRPHANSMNVSESIEMVTSGAVSYTHLTLPTNREV